MKRIATENKEKATKKRKAAEDQKKRKRAKTAEANNYESGQYLFVILCTSSHHDVFNADSDNNFDGLQSEDDGLDDEEGEEDDDDDSKAPRRHVVWLHLDAGTVTNYA
jgi:hypothetical protein